MKKNYLALNVGEEALIEDFGIVKCIVDDKVSNNPCNTCCFGKGLVGGCKAIQLNLYAYCIDDDRKDKNLDNPINGVVYTRVTAINKNKINKV